MNRTQVRSLCLWAAGIAAVALLLPLAAPGSKYFQFMIEMIMIFMLAATGLNIAIGLAGQYQMAQGAIMAVAAYSAAVFHLDLGWGVGAALLGAFAIAMVIGVCVAAFSARLSSHYLLLATFGFQVIVVGIIREISVLTGGVNGRPAIVAFDLFGINLVGSTSAYSTVLILVAGVGLFACEWIKRSFLGLGMQAARQNERVINASGIFANRFKFLAVAIGAAFAAVAGMLVGPVQTYLVPDSFSIEITLLLLVIVILGGAGSTFGVAVAAIVLSIASQIAQSATTAWPLIYGLFIMIMLTLTSRGLAGLGELVAPLVTLLGRTAATEPVHAATPSAAFAGVGAVPRAPGIGIVADGPVVLRASGLQRSFGGVVALRDVSVEAVAGSVLGVVGPNGSGKTTLFEVISGFVRHDQGQISAFGEEIGRLGPVERARLGIGRSFQHPTILRECSVRENVLLGAMPFVPGSRRLLPLGEPASPEAWRRAADALALVGLADMASAPAGKLSYGQRKLLDIARVIAAAPKIVLLDEPVAGVDAISANRVKSVVEHLRAKGCTVLLVEHNMRFVMGLSDRVVVLNSGAVIAEGTPAEVARNEAVIRSYLGTRDHAKPESPSSETLPIVPGVQLAKQS